MKKIILSYGLLLICTVFFSCKKKTTTTPNPFDDPALQAPPKQTSSYNPDPTSFDYLFYNVFNPTCANSNCHDGAFQPDFRTISSAYNTLVYAPVIITPTLNPYTYRVLPGNANASILKHRLTQLPGSGIGTLGQGRMPFIDTNFLYSSSGSVYVQRIIDWINAGAKDIYGNTPTLGNKNPSIYGFQICNSGSPTSKGRNKYIEISKSNGPVDLWFYVTDDVTDPSAMVSSEIKLSKKRYDFSSAATTTTMPLSYVASGNTYKDITNKNDVKYNFKLTGYNLASFQADTGYIFVRTYIKDASHTTPGETPNNGSSYYQDYFTIKIIP